MPSCRSGSLWWLGLGPLLAGCPPEIVDPPDDKTEFLCEIGNHDGQPWAPLDEQDAEMTLGFQGFLFVPFRLRADDAPALVDAQMSLEVSGLGPIAGEQPQVAFVCEGSSCLTADVLLFLTGSSIGRYVGEKANMTVRVEDAERYCITTARVTLVDDECDPEMENCT